MNGEMHGLYFFYPSQLILFVYILIECDKWINSMK